RVLTRFGPCRSIASCTLLVPPSPSISPGNRVVSSDSDQNQESHSSSYTRFRLNLIILEYSSFNLNSVIDMEETFTHVRTMISKILGLGIAQLLKNAAKLIDQIN